MGMPNAQLKIKSRKGDIEVTFKSNVDAVKWSISQLSNAALWSIARVIMYRVTKNLSTAFPALKSKISSTRRKNAIQYWLRRYEGDLKIGYGKTAGRGAGNTGTAYYAIPAELGTTTRYAVAGRPYRSVKGGEIIYSGITGKPQPKVGVLRNSTYESLGDIERIYQQYFKQLDSDHPSITEIKEEIEGAGE